MHLLKKYYLQPNRYSITPPPSHHHVEGGGTRFRSRQELESKSGIHSLTTPTHEWGQIRAHIYGGGGARGRHSINAGNTSQKHLRSRQPPARRHLGPANLLISQQYCTQYTLCTHKGCRKLSVCVHVVL